MAESLYTDTWPPRLTRSHQKGDLTPVDVQKGAKRREAQARLDAAYAIAEQRDQMKCRCTGVLLSKDATDAARRLEHHHLEPRSIKPERREDPTNIVCISARVHRLEKLGWIVCEGIDARQELFWHWTALAKSKPLVIKRHNTIQCAHERGHGGQG